ncbi:MAG: dipeptidase [Deltaproteobacteria bacterium]|nr:dipeptidase [Deltaproteobacteria bacterium]
MKDILTYLKKEKGRFVEELCELLQIPSISTSEAHKPQMAQAASWVSRQLKKVGVKDVTVHKTAGHPIVTGHTPHVAGAPTVLVYGHYDVQPAEPLELWKTPPFEPTVLGSKLFARGSADDKGQFYIHLKVLEAFKQVRGGVPINVKVLIEGEEEIGSPSLVPFLRQHKKDLACDAILVSDTHMHGLKTPSITTSLRGLTCLEVKVRTASTDMHSGTYGGAIANANQVLAELLVQCKDPKTGKVKIPGFYDEVRKLTPAQRRGLKAIPHDDARYARSVGAREVFGERGFTSIERAGARPTFEVNGMWGGHIGEGIKTVLPAEAGAKISMRLVADQDPTVVAKRVKAHLLAIAPPHAKVSVRKLDNDGLPVMVAEDSPAMAVACEAVEKVFGVAPFLALEGGSIPIVADFKKVLGADPILLGFGLPDDNLHAPNEKFDLRMFDRGLATVAYFFELFGAQGRG